MRFIFFPLFTLLGMLLTAMMWVYGLHLEPVLTSTGLTLQDWLLLDLAWIVGSGIFCWLMSSEISRWSTDTVYIQADAEPQLFAALAMATSKLSLSTTPKIGVYPSQEVNLFSAGFLPSKSLLAVSKGFLQLDIETQSQLLMHELIKIRNGSTSLLALCQGMTYGLNLYIARILALLLGTSFLTQEGESWSNRAELVVNVLTTLFLTLWGSLLVYYLSRTRQHWADKELKEVAGSKVLNSNLEFLEKTAPQVEQRDVFTATLKASARPQAWRLVFATHPEVNKRKLRA